MLLLLSFILIFSSTFVLASNDYKHIGYNDYRLGNSKFNGVAIIDSDDYNTAVRGLTNRTYTPLVADLDGDGTREIVVLDGSTFRIYNSKDLDIADVYAVASGSRFSNFILYDIDDDNLTEIIIASTDTDKIEIIEYNGSSIYSQQNFTWSSDGGQASLFCGAVNDCILVSVKYISSFGGSVPSVVSGIGFSSSAIASHSTVLDTSPVTPPHLHCFPSINTIEYEDYDNDGVNEYIFNVIQVHSAGVETAITITLETNSSNHVILDDSNELTMGNTFDNSPLYCEDNALGKYITAPLVYDLDGGSSNGKEIAFGYMTSTDTFKMKVYDRNFGTVNDHPEVLTADGQIVSNVIRANIFPETKPSSDDWDYCVMGYKDASQEIDLLCGSSLLSFFSLESDEFPFSTAGRYNISKGYYDYDAIIHTVEASTFTVDGQNIDEILTSYGVFKVDYSGSNELELLFENPKGTAVVLSSDVENNGQEDLLVMTHTNLWYIDDKFSKSGAEIDHYYIDPCLDAVWKVQNTSNSLEVRITAIDPDSDSVSTKAELYFSESYEQDSGWKVNSSSGTTFTFPFTINTTIATGVLKLSAVDTSNPTEIDEILLSFSVGDDGVLKGQCVTDIDVETSLEANVTEDSTATINRSLVYTGITNLDEATGLNIGLEPFWLLGIFIVVIFSVITGFYNHQDAIHIFFIVGAELTVGVLLGVTLGIVSTIWVFVLVLGFIAVATVGIRKLIVGG